VGGPSTWQKTAKEKQKYISENMHKISTISVFCLAQGCRGCLPGIVHLLLRPQIPKPYLAACFSSSSSSLRALAQMRQQGRRRSACEQPRKLRMPCLSWRLARPCCELR
jgi:hypothetical protein